jgi:hypothetical protein
VVLGSMLTPRVWPPVSLPGAGAHPTKKLNMLSRSVVFFMLHLLIIGVAVAIANLTAEIEPALASLH